MSGETLRVCASYAVGGTFGKGHKAWFGATRAEPVVVKVAEDCIVAPKRPLSADPLVDELIEKLDSCLPPGWERLRVKEGKVRPAYMPEGPGVRVDTHLSAGYIVPPFYDALLAKLIAWAPTRSEAIARAARALDEFQLDGLKTTIPFHQQVMANAYFRRGEVATNFLQRRMGLA